jgi:hypothetical protein
MVFFVAHTYRERELPGHCTGLKFVNHGAGSMQAIGKCSVRRA